LGEHQALARVPRRIAGAGTSARNATHPTAQAVPERQTIKNHVLLFCQGSGGASGNLYQVSAPSKVATTDITAGHASSKPMSATQCVASAHVGASLPAGAGKELVVQYRCMPPPSAARV
jgi:hypothetical protein